MYIYTHTHTHTHTHTRQSISDPESNRLGPFSAAALPHRHDPACVIAQQHSSTIYVSLHLHYCKEKFGARFKNVIIYLTFFKTA